MPTENGRAYVLGIDLGSASVGWALIEVPDGVPRGLLAAGVRVFDPGVDGDLERGQEESRNRKRREARLARRGTWRRAWRRQKLFAHLQQAGLLPPTPVGREVDPPEARAQVLEALDVELRARWQGRAPEAKAEAHVLPYVLRARALVERLEPYELGRGLYHLGQRRGFLSNRKSAPKKDEEEGKVQAGISELAEEMKKAGAETLGEHFVRLDAEQRRIRSRWTARLMFMEEFENIWATQAAYHPNLLTPGLKKLLHHTLFYQRPVRWKRSTIGVCELEQKGRRYADGTEVRQTRRRAPMACLAAQRFRALQAVNNLEAQDPDGRRIRLTDPAMSDARRRLADALEHNQELSFNEVRKLLKMPKARKDRPGFEFNLERAGEKKLKGNRTAAAMRQYFGARWEELSPSERDRVVEEWRTAEKEESLARRLNRHWGLGEEQARELSEKKAEQGYCGHSRLALSKLLPLMEEGVPYASAVEKVYGERFQGGQAEEELPPVRKALPEVRNPAVERALTEMRKVINAIVRKYDKPAEVRIELARDLRNPKKARQEIWEKNREREREKEQARKALEEGRIPRPSRRDIEKYLLWQECREHCPYTGKSISFDALFGQLPQFDVEHILPFDRFPDDSFLNKTLCEIRTNREVKKKQTPWEAFGQTAEWPDMVRRMEKFGNKEKLRRFGMKATEAEALMEEFRARQLNDTRYASKLAAAYLGRLYGGRDVAREGEAEPARRVVRATSGQVTALLRKAWKLESILGSGEGKGRHDHRHHAVDAVVTALTEDGWIQKLAERAAHNREKYGALSFGGLTGPWPDFVESVRKVIEGMRVSHRPEHKLKGQLHQETSYSPPRNREGGREPEGDWVHVRKPLDQIKSGDIEDIVDGKVREAVQQRLSELGGDLKRLQASASPLRSADDTEGPPYLVAKDGRRIPIRKVRIRQRLKVETIGQGVRERHVKLGNNHHVEIVAVVDEQGEEKSWEAKVVSRLKALQRKQDKDGRPIVQREHGPGKAFKFSLMGGDLVEIDVEGGRGLYVLRTIGESSQGKVQFALARATDARRLQDMKKEKKEKKRSEVFPQPVPDTLRQLHCRKVVVGLLGELKEAHD